MPHSVNVRSLFDNQSMLSKMFRIFLQRTEHWLGRTQLWIESHQISPLIALFLFRWRQCMPTASSSCLLTWIVTLCCLQTYLYFVESMACDCVRWPVSVVSDTKVCWILVSVLWHGAKVVNVSPVLNGRPQCLIKLLEKADLNIDQSQECRLSIWRTKTYKSDQEHNNRLRLFGCCGLKLKALQTHYLKYLSRHLMQV